MRYGTNRRCTIVQKRDSLCGSVTNGCNKAVTLNKTDDEDDQIKQWLSPLEPWYKQQSVQTDRVDGVGGWLLGREQVLGVEW